MTKNLATEKLTLNLVEWANGVNNPNTATVSGGKGSWYQRSANGAATPTEIYLNLFGTTTGWVKQNLININVFNVVNFGATGDGVTDDTDAIQAAITAAEAAGNGWVYFPATPNYYKVAKRLSAFASFDLANRSNLTFIGDGYASKIKLEGNGGLATWYMWHIHDGTTNCQWINLYFDTAGVTNAAEQTHVFNPSSETTDTHGGANQLQWLNCYFGNSVGDGIRFLGATPAVPTFNHLVKYCSFDMEGARAPIGGQRNTERIRVFYNWLTGSNDQNIDFEATGTGTPARWSIYGNIVDAQNKGVQTVTLGGQGTAPSNSISFICNQIHRGGSVFAVDTTRLHVHGNIILITSTTGPGSNNVLDLQDGVVECQITGNVMDAPGATHNVNGIFLTSSTHNPRNNLIADNIIKSVGDITGGSNVFVEESQDTTVCGNICEGVNANVGKSSPIIFRTITHSIDGLLAEGNFVWGSSAALKAGVTFAAGDGFTLGNSLGNHNIVRNAANSVRWDDVGSTGTFVDWRGAIGNNGPANTAVVVFVPPDQNIGSTVEGNPGPAPRMIQFDDSIDGPSGGVGGVPSPVGSLATNISGSDATVLWQKTAAASPTSVAGWDSIGPSELEFAAQNLTTTTTALFLATGMDLANAVATEIQVAVPRAGTIRAMRLACVAGTGGGNVTFTVRKNGVDMGLTLTVANTATTGSSSSATFTVAAGDLISISITKTGVIASGQTLATMTLEFA